ncbi:MAG: metallophosphoesterase family protein [Desulfococcaceae bacterium]
MKLLLFGDIHGDMDAIAAVVRQSRDADVAIGAGDFALFRQGLAATMAALSGIRIPTILVHGNHESLEELVRACGDWKEAHVLHGNSVEILGATFFGLGGATPVTPFPEWSVDVPEWAAARLLSECPPGAILVSHSPPLGCLDEIEGNRRIGSRAVRDFVVDRKPPLVVCGHIHETWARREYLAGVPVVNPGPAGRLLPFQTNSDGFS